MDHLEEVIVTENRLAEELESLPVRRPTPSSQAEVKALGDAAVKRAAEQHVKGHLRLSPRLL